MLAREPARGHRQGHHVLELVAKSIRAPRLVEGGSRPDATGQRLVEEPAVEHQVHRTVGRLDLDGAGDVVPLGRDDLEDEVEVEAAIAGHERASLIDRRRLSEEEHDLGAAARRQVDLRLKGRAGIEAGADPAGWMITALQQSRMVRRAVLAQEFRAISGPCGLVTAEVREGDAIAELRIPGVLGEERPRGQVDLGDDERRAHVAREAEHPLDVCGHGETAGLAGPVLDREPRDLHRVLDRHELQEVEGDAVRRMLESAVALTMPNDVGRGVLPDRKRGRTPERAGVLVADIDRLARRIGHRIVGPRRELVLPTID